METFLTAENSRILFCLLREGKPEDYLQKEKLLYRIIGFDSSGGLAVTHRAFHFLQVTAVTMAKVKSNWKSLSAGSCSSLSEISW